VASPSPSGVTNFRDDLTKITMPTLILHGDSDEIVPWKVLAREHTLQSLEAGCS
jgi:pimeloyl-ACP methyl ester carboxylesterase